MKAKGIDPIAKIIVNKLKLIKIKKAKKHKAKIITTEKDYNRLNKLNSEGIEYLEIELKITNEKELINFLNKKL